MAVLEVGSARSGEAGALEQVVVSDELLDLDDMSSSEAVGDVVPEMGVRAFHHIEAFGLIA